MKKSLIALAALASAGIASAQSSVTLFGIVDASVTNYSNKSEDATGVSRTNSRTELANSQNASSRIGFRGIEDLGGGLAASFWLEAGISNDNGAVGGSAITSGVSTATNMFNRRSTVSLSGSFGEIRLGRDMVPAYLNDSAFDPFAANGVGTSLIKTAGDSFAGPQYVRASNLVSYFLPANIGGFYGQATYAFSENTDDGVNDVSKAGDYYGGRLGFAKGPLDVAAGYADSTTANNVLADTKNSVKTYNLGASYDLGVVKLFGEVSRMKQENEVATTNEVDLTGYLIGASVPVGVGSIRVAYSHVKYDLNDPTSSEDPNANKFAIGYVHNLSKRTALYATVARVSNKDGAALSVGGPGFYNTAANTFTAKTSTGYDLGIRHAF